MANSNGHVCSQISANTYPLSTCSVIMLNMAAITMIGNIPIIKPIMTVCISGSARSAWCPIVACASRCFSRDDVLAILTRLAVSPLRAA